MAPDEFLGYLLLRILRQLPRHQAIPRTWLHKHI